MFSNRLLDNAVRTQNNTNISESTRPKFLSATTDEECLRPAFCEASLFSSCADTKVSQCEECNYIKATLLLVTVLCLGILIIFGNILTIAVGIYRRKKGTRQRVDNVRSSLALADLFTGVQLIIVVVYNFFWITNSTGNEIKDQTLSLQGSSGSIASGIFNVFTYTSSLYHLLFMGSQRLRAISQPIEYKLQSNKTVYYGLTVIWILSALSATLPAWFPEKMTFSYYSSTLMYWPALKSDSKQAAILPAIALIFMFYILPFILMTCITIACAIFFRLHMKKSRRLTIGNIKAEDAWKIQERTTFKTVSIMQLGFTITMSPLAIVSLLFFTEKLDCSSVSLPYIVCFYLTMSNSIVNVMIYSIRDRGFRASIYKMLQSNVESSPRTVN